ncbi:MAG: hypothetical protein AAF236_11505, partial [Verrucomicrobiota bacterium]
MGSLLRSSIVTAVFITTSLALSEEWEGKTLVIPVRDSDVASATKIREFGKMLDAARESSVAGIVLEIDVSESVGWDQQRRLLELLAANEAPTVSWIKSTATGPGVLLALAGDRIFLTESGIIGAGGLPQPASEDGEKASDPFAQERSILLARVRSLAKARGHRAIVAEALVESTRELEIDGEILSDAESALTLTAEEATATFGGEPLLAEGVVGSLKELVKRAKLSEETVRISPRDWSEQSHRDRLSEATKSTETPAESAESEEEGETRGDGIFTKRDQESYEGKVVVFEVGQQELATGKSNFEFMDRVLRQAQVDGAEAVVFEMDTPGGYAWYTEGLVLNSLQDVSIPTYTFVNTRAYSAGAIIAIGTDEIYMRPAATIGSALVVMGTGADLPEAMNDKVTQAMIATVRNVAELNGHNPDVAQAFVTRDHAVEVD